MEHNFNVKLADKWQRQRELVLKLDDANPNEQHILSFLRNGMSYEPDVTKLLQKILEPGDVFVDVGGNVGYFTLLGSMLVGPEGKVFTFEPDPKNIDRIRTHCQNNDCGNVEIIVQPASHAIEDVTFYFNKSSSGGNALWNPGEYFGDPAYNDGYSVMQSTTLTTEFGKLGLEDIKLIKIDTEGAEHAILRGTQDWLKNQTVPFIIAELNSFGLQKLGSSNDAFIDFMYQNGYLAFLLYLDGRRPEFICPGMNIQTVVISNILFTTPLGFAKLWPQLEHNPGVVLDKATGKMGIAA